MAANVRDRFDSGGIVAIRERPESALSGSSSSTSSASGFAPNRTSHEAAQNRPSRAHYRTFAGSPWLRHL